MFKKGHKTWNKGKNLIKKGNKFNYLTAIKFSYEGKRSQQFWLFKCDCGVEKIIRSADVKNGKTKSCGCLNKRLLVERSITHGKRKTRTYKSWCSMKQRCLNKKYNRYKDYGGRGITICPEWMIFENFYEDMGDRPEGKSLDRIDNNGNYYKENCRWATPTEQNNNTRKNLTN